MKRMKVFLVMIIMILSSLNLNVQSQAKNNYIIEDDRVYIDDENVYMSIRPYFTSGGWVYFDFAVKNYRGEIDIGFGFNTTNCKPKKIELHTPNRLVNRENNYTIPKMFYNGTLGYRMNYTYTNQDSLFLYDGEVWLWYYNNIDMSDDPHGFKIGWNCVYNQIFDRADKTNKIIYWVESYYKNWKDISSIGWEKINYVYDELNIWYLKKNINVEYLTYSIRIWIDVIPKLNGTQSKYGVILKPSNLSILEAKNQGYLYYLDPWYNNNWDYKVSHVINAAGGAGTNYQIKLNCEFELGVNSGDMIYFNTHIQADFDDVRITDNDESTLLDIWLESKTNSDKAIFWFKPIDSLSSSSITVYIYYGNPSASSISSGDDTFLFFDDFNDGSIDLTKWTIFGSPTESGGELIASGSAILDYGVSGKTNFLYNVAMRSRNNIATAAVNVYTGFGGVTGYIHQYKYTHPANIRHYTNNGVNFGYTSTSKTSGVYYIIDLSWLNGESKLWMDGTLETTRTQYVPTQTLPNQLGSGLNGGQLKVDWVLVRKYVSPEPTHGSWGNQEFRQINKPIMNYMKFNNTLENTNTLIVARVIDTEGLSGYIFWHNVTNQPSGVNSTWIPLSGTSILINITLTLCENDLLVGFKFYINDTDNYWTAGLMVLFMIAQKNYYAPTILMMILSIPAVLALVVIMKKGRRKRW